MNKVMNFIKINNMLVVYLVLKMGVIMELDNMMMIIFYIQIHILLNMRILNYNVKQVTYYQ